MENNNLKERNDSNLKYRKLIYYILGVLEVLLLFRLILKVLGSNPDSTFVDIIYTISNILVAPFAGIFRVAVTKGIETKAVLEPATVIAMIVYAVVAIGIVKLIEIMSNRKGSQIM